MTEHARLRNLVHTAVSDALDGAQECDALDYPLHYNAGDAAIWLGQQATLRCLGVDIRSVSTHVTYDARRLTGRAPIVILGGGNFGGLYPTRHAMKLQVLSDFPDRPIIQLPQSIEYPDERSRDELRHAIDAHPNFTLLVRDRRSFEIAQHDFDCRTVLCPDIAFGLPALQRAAPMAGLAALVRTDKESSNAPPIASDVQFDWLAARPTERVWWTRAGFSIGNRVERRRHVAPPDRWFTKFGDFFAQENLRRGIRLLSQGEYLVTDRLHGHVLACLAGIPNVVVADKYGKIEALWSTWTHQFPDARFCKSWDGAADAVVELRSAA